MSRAWKAIGLVCICILLIAGVGYVVTRGNSGQDNDGPSGEKSFSVNRKTGISSELSPRQLKAEAKRQGFTTFFWLGAPSAGEDVRVAVPRKNDKRDVLAIAYTDADKRQRYDKGTEVEFSNLVNTSRITVPAGKVKDTLEKELAVSAESIQAHDGFKAYVLLPPAATRFQSDIFLISDDYRYLGRVVSGSAELLAAQRKHELITLAGKLEMNAPSAG